MSKKNNGTKFMGGLTGKRFRYRWYSLLLTVLVVAVVIVFNLIVGAAEDKWALKIDASSNQVTSFSDQTYEVLDNLDQPVHIYLLFQKATQSDLRITLEEIVNKYRARNSNITVETIDPVNEPGRVNQYKDSDVSLAEGSIIVTNGDETRVKLIKAGDLYNYTFDQQTYNYNVTGFNGESKLTTALMYVSSEDTPNVYYLTGHNEIASSSCSVLTTQLTNENYEVSDLELGTGTQLAAGDTVVVLAPSTDLTDDEYAEMSEWLKNGGRMMYVNDVSIDMSKLPNFTKLLDYYALSFKDGYVVEGEAATSSYLTDQRYVVPKLDSEHDITSALSGSGRLIMPMPRAIADPEMPLSGYTYTKLLTTSSQSFQKAADTQTNILKQEAGDETGPFTLAMGMLYQPDYEDPSKDTRIVLMGSLYALADTNYLYSTNNLDFTMNAFDWLVNRDVSVYIRSKSMASEQLAIPDATTLWLLTAIVVIVIPAIVLVAGIWVWVKRRRL